MRVSAGNGPTQRRGDTFTGRVWADSALPAADGVALTTVIFEPGARSHRHRHEIGPVLHITHGEGWLQSASGEGRVLTPGDVAHIPAGEPHWHGATAESLMSHVAVSIGSTEWMQAVSDDDCSNAFGRGSVVRSPRPSS